jgi:multiple sugar transport system permease protein
MSATFGLNRGNAARSGVSATRSRMSRERLRRRIPGAIATIILVIGAIGMVAPFLWMFATSMRQATHAFDLPPDWFPWPPRVDNYQAAVSGPVPLLRNMFNSAVIAICVSIGQLITSPLAGYAFAKLRFPGRTGLFLLLLTGLMIPAQVTIIPLFIMMSNLGFVDDPRSLILPGLTGAFGVFLMRQFFLTVPQELLEAARIDGAGAFTTYRLVALPLAKPALTALGTIVFLGSWNAYFAPLIFLQSIEKATMPLGLVVMLGPYSSGNVAVIMAATTIAILPALILFLLAQRWIVESMTRSGLKG